MARFFTDITISQGLVEILRQKGHDALTVLESGLALPDTSKDRIKSDGKLVECMLQYAKEQQRILITLNSSFHTWRWQVKKHAGIVTFENATSPIDAANLIENELQSRDSFEGRYLFLRTPLQLIQNDLDLAAFTGKMDQVQQLLSGAPNLNVSGVMKSACYRGHFAIVQRLLEYGADVNFQDSDGATALMYACGMTRLAGSKPELGSRADFEKIIQLLLAHDAQVNTQDSNGKTAMHYILEEGGDPVLEQLLIKAGADLTIHDKKGIIPASFHPEWSTFLPPPLYDIQEVLTVDDPNKALVKFAENVNPRKTNTNAWETGLCAFSCFETDVYCDGLEAAFERLFEGDLWHLHFVLGAVGALELRAWLEKAVSVIDPDLLVNNYHQFRMPHQLTGEQTSSLNVVERQFDELNADTRQMAFEFMKKNQNLFGWRYGDRKRQKLERV